MRIAVMRVSIIAFAIASTCTATQAAEVQVTLPVAACESMDVYETCTPSVLHPGEKFDLDTDYLSKPGFVLLWRRTCPNVDHGCVPAATPVWVLREDWPSFGVGPSGRTASGR
jgi:hypothetical protein